ncbi:MAG: hypothetical protein KGR26_06610 [Cyanobacteria bacterium REEB65]|nr:hypothetical protein [Cyanobacteria bacterium REEB65]
MGEVYGLTFALTLAFGAAMALAGGALFSAFKGREEDYERELPEAERKEFEQIELAHEEQDLAPAKFWDKL